MKDFISKYKDLNLPLTNVTPFGETLLDLRSIRPWKVPEKIAITVAPVGSIITKDQNPNQPYTVDEIIRESIASVEAGACSVHVHVRDEKGFPSGDRELTMRVVNALRARFGANVHIDGEVGWGNTFEEMMRPITEGWYESAAVNCTTCFFGDTLVYLPPPTCKATAEVIKAYGKGLYLATYNPGDIDNTDRWLIQTGIVKPPFIWGIGAGMPGGSPMWDPLSMVETFLHMMRRIMEVDKSEHPNIIVPAAGRASSYLTTLAILLGCHVRVGMEDTIYRVPHRNDVITSNKQLVEETVTIARFLGREPMTAVEYREMLGIKPFI